MSDQLKRFLFKELNVRGEYVYLKAAWQEMMSRRIYPANVRNLLGELVAATALLGATIKIEGKLTVQIQSTGAVSLMVAQLTHSGGIRAIAKHVDQPIGTDLKTLCGQGQLVITLESIHSKTPYQGVIPLIDDSIKLALERYFETSEQLPTRLELAADQNCIAGLFIQKLPGTVSDEDAFNRVSHLSSTVTREELLTLPCETLLVNLFHEEDIILFDSESLRFECTCSRERTFAMLNQFTQTEITEMLQENNGKIEVDCQFCGKAHVFDEIDIKAAGHEPSRTHH